MMNRGWFDIKSFSINFMLFLRNFNSFVCQANTLSVFLLVLLKQKKSVCVFIEMLLTFWYVFGTNDLQVFNISLWENIYCFSDKSG